MSETEEQTSRMGQGQQAWPSREGTAASQNCPGSLAPPCLPRGGGMTRPWPRPSVSASSSQAIWAPGSALFLPHQGACMGP